jgi:diacylglycerol kinase family enzyme
VIFVNPNAGGGNESDEFAEQFHGHDVVECDPSDLAEQVRKALESDDRPAFVGVAGGDGTIRCAIEVVLDVAPEVPVLAVPAGTRNHFARDLGLEDVETAAAAASGGNTRVIDVAGVNDSLFVNNSSIGVYPRLVAHREARESDMPKGLAAVVAAWHQLRRGRRIRVSVDGAPVRAWAVFIGNNCYGESLRDLIGRDAMDEGVLDVRIAHADRRLSRLRIVGAVLFGKVATSPLIDRLQRASVTLDLGDGTPVPVALDGEVVDMASPLRYESKPKALTVLLPPSNSGRLSTP